MFRHLFLPKYRYAIIELRFRLQHGSLTARDSVRGKTLHIVFLFDSSLDITLDIKRKYFFLI